VVRQSADAGDTVLFAEVADRPTGDSELAKAWLVAKQQGNYQTIDELTPPKLPIGYLLGASRLAVLLPADFYRWLAIRNPNISIYAFSYTPANRRN